MRDADLRSPNFFDVEKFPTMTFKSKQFFREGSQLKVKGDLTMHGVTKEVVLDVDGPSPEVKVFFPGVTSELEPAFRRRSTATIGD